MYSKTRQFFTLSDLPKAKVYFLFSETKKCWTHSDCPSHLRCTNGYCGDPTYFKALQEHPCEEDKQCEVKLDLLLFENISAEAETKL